MLFVSSRNRVERSSVGTLPVGSTLAEGRQGGIGSGCGAVSTLNLPSEAARIALVIADWLDWARRLQAISQSGLTYAGDAFDRERYEQVRAIAAEIMASHSDDPSESTERVEKLFVGQSGYATPKLDIRAVILDRENAVLLVREKEDGLWTLPGGWVDVGESPREAAEREVQEESGYEVRAVRLLALWDRDKHPHPPLPFHVYKLYVLCELVGGGPIRESAETAGVGFFDVDDLPRLSEGRVLPEQVERLAELARRQHGAADLD
jgi:ADP-ribose pyrophosphatase YjhB (NUDIX family)